jgi:hypothetical protein
MQRQKVEKLLHSLCAVSNTQFQEHYRLENGALGDRYNAPKPLDVEMARHLF